MKNRKSFLPIAIIALIFLIGCGQNNNKEKELELKEKELRLKEKELALDSVKKANLNNTPNNVLVEKQSNSPTQVNSEVKTLNESEYGLVSFDIPCGNKGWSLSLNFIKNTNKVYSYEGGIVALGEVGESSSKGTFIVNKIDANFKYITCKFPDNVSYKLKYSIRKRVWIVLPDCSNMSGELVKEVEARK